MKKISKYITLFLLLHSVGFSQSIRDSLFRSTDDKLNLALSLQAKIMSPENFSEGLDYYNEASELINNEISNYKSDNAQLQMWTGIDSDLEKKIRNLLKTSRGYFEQSIKLSRIAQVVFENALVAKSDAEKVDAAHLAPKLWSDAYQFLKDVAKELEDGNFDYAKENSVLIEKSFRDAELAAIKEKYIGAVKDSINYAYEQDIVDYAPITLVKARNLAVSSENLLNSDRYNTEMVKKLADESIYEVSHAFYIANFIKKKEAGRESLEDLILHFEDELNIIAKSLNLNVRFNKGTKNVVNQITEEISEIKDNNTRLNNKNYNLIRKIFVLRNIKDSLESDFSSLQKKMTSIKTWITNYEKIKTIFSNESSDVIFDKDSIIIRLYNINFAPKKSQSDTTVQKLILKIKKALILYPKNKIIIASFTDSYGNERTNRLLSQERADTIKSRLTNMLAFDSGKILAIGMGESSPIAENRTNAGRKKNRRLEIIIKNILSNN